MKRVNLAGEERPGDIFFQSGTGWLSDGIREAELVLHPGAPRDFVPSHAGIVAYDGKVIEAWLSATEDSVCALNPLSKYDLSKLEFWRADRTDAQVAWAIEQHVKAWASQPYGWPDLFGFLDEAIIKAVTGKVIGNPIHWSYVCSQGVALFLSGYPSNEPWLAELGLAGNLQNLDPLGLRLACLAHEG